MDPLERLTSFAKLNRHVQESLDIIETALTTYRPESVAISFNGGKDCTAVLYMVHAVSRRLFPARDSPSQLTAFYAPLPNHFKEESDFVHQTAKQYNLNLMQYSSSSLKTALASFKLDAPHTEAVFIGSRRDDFKPGSKITTLAPTDNDWPQFMRIHPILDWSYSQVWTFIRELDIPYCDLYNQGYSSLGTQDNTTKNSSLLRYKDNGEPYYLPAWSLSKSQEERLSRSSSMN